MTQIDSKPLATAEGTGEASTANADTPKDCNPSDLPVAPESHGKREVSESTDVANEPPSKKLKAVPSVNGNPSEAASSAASPSTIASPSTVLLDKVSEGIDGAVSEGRSRRPRRSNVVMEAIKPKARAKKPRTVVKDAEEEFKTAWICCECKEAECMIVSDADQLLICEGTCRRLFHYPCAGLSKPPAVEEAYICQDCRGGKHMCSFCQMYGIDNEDVFPCCAAQCGLYFHEACLEMNAVEVKLIETSLPRMNGATSSTLDGEDAVTGEIRREFQCPAHACGVCTQSDMLENEQKEADASRKTNKKGRGRKKAKVVDSAFGQKTGTTIRCILCPNSYHLSCIPPTARFNELSMLCPDHVASDKLPEVDPETSLQASIEKKIDKKFADVVSPSRRKANKAKQKNPFFHGLSGSKMTADELELVNGFENDDEHGPMDPLSFCIPCKFRDEVHAKPPAYKHIHTLKYGKVAPKKVEKSGETCSCIGVCDEACFNRVLYVECTGEKGSNSSICAVGRGCGNRSLGQKKFKKCLPKREQGKGWGLVTQQDIYKGELITEYVGEVVDEETKEVRLAEWAKDHPNDPNFYVMQLSKQWYIDARREANLSRFINHSCDPNAILVTINVNDMFRNGIFALQDISAGSFLSYDYHFDTRHGDRFVCRCGSANCRGTMKDRALEADAADKSKRQLWEDAKRDYDRDKAFMEDFHAKRQERESQVDAMVPGWEFPSDLVANGPPSRHRVEAQQGRIFLWRNVRLGADFSRRFSRLEAKRSGLAEKGPGGKA